MRSRALIAMICMVAAIIFGGCHRLPKGVLSKEEMASLLIDIHKGESLVELERMSYNNDSLRKVLKQSIYMAHGVTAEQVDTSFVWYGNHIEDYIEIYDNVIKTLEEEVHNADRAAGAPVYAVGDSIDVWNLAPNYRIDDRLPVKYLTFNFDRDENWEKGDNYTLQFKLLNERGEGDKATASLFVKYNDGELEYKSHTLDIGGWSKLRLVTDSTRIPESVFGSVAFTPSKGETLYVDSMALVRTRFIPSTYMQRASQRRLFRAPRRVESQDSVVADVDDANLLTVNKLPK